jgi:hypothetical protein
MSFITVATWHYHVITRFSKREGFYSLGSVAPTDHTFA